MTKINCIHNDWKAVKNACRTTVNKIHTENEPSAKFKEDILISEHSPIRLIRIHWLWESIKSWVATHWSRHKFECFISTQRSDRTGINRDEEPQNSPVSFEGDANAQSLIDAMRKRLCTQASPETRELAIDLKKRIGETEPELASVLVPNCIYRCGCSEFSECGYWRSFISDKNKEELINIRKRYELYNKEFKERYER